MSCASVTERRRLRIEVVDVMERENPRLGSSTFDDNGNKFPQVVLAHGRSRRKRGLTSVIVVVQPYVITTVYPFLLLRVKLPLPQNDYSVVQGRWSRSSRRE